MPCNWCSWFEYCYIYDTPSTFEKLYLIIRYIYIYIIQTHILRISFYIVVILLKYLLLIILVTTCWHYIFIIILFQLLSSLKFRCFNLLPSLLSHIEVLIRVRIVSFLFMAIILFLSIIRVSILIRIIDSFSIV